MAYLIKQLLIHPTKVKIITSIGYRFGIILCTNKICFANKQVSVSKTLNSFFYFIVFQLFKNIFRVIVNKGEGMQI
jgi:hypothetical protein